jgi:hypothetical protein
MICALPSTDGRPIVAAFPLELQNKALTLSVADDDFRVHTWNFNNVDYVKLKGVDGVRRYVDGGICFLDAARTNGSRFVCAAAGSDEAIVARIADGEVDRVIRAPKCSDDEKTENFAYLRFISVSGNGTFAIICWQQQQLQAFGDKRIGDCQQSTTTLWNLEIGCSFGVVENCLFAAFVPGDQHAVFITVNEDERKNSFSIVKYDLDKERSKTGYSSFGQFPAGKFIGAVAVAFSADKSILIAFLMENNHFPNNATLLICSQDYCKTIDLEELMMEESVLGKRTCEVRPYDMKLLGGTTALIAVETSSETCSFVVIDLSSASIISVINSLPFGRNVMSILTSCDSQTGVVVSFGANKLFQCSLRNGAEVANLKCCRSSVSCIITEQTASFLSNSNLLIAIESTRRHVAFISTDDGSVRFRLAVHGYALVLCLTGNDAKRTIVIGCDDGRVLLFAL